MSADNLHSVFRQKRSIGFSHLEESHFFYFPASPLFIGVCGVFLFSIEKVFSIVRSIEKSNSIFALSIRGNDDNDKCSLRRYLENLRRSEEFKRV